MGEAGRRRLDHVVLPRRLPGLALLERYFPSPADNQLDAELSAFARAGDTVLDPWAGTGWTARRAIAHGLRAVSADPSPFAQLAAQAFLLAPDPSAIDSAFNQLASSRRVDVPLRQHIEELYASRCAVCRHPVVGDQFIWPRDADAPGRKIYRCSNCEISVGGAEERVAPVDEVDLAKLGIERPSDSRADIESDPSIDAEDDLPAAPVGLTGVETGTSVAAYDPADHSARDALGEPGEPPPPPAITPDAPTGPGSGQGPGPRFASTVRPDPLPPQAATEVRKGPHYQQLRDRFPVLDGQSALVDELLELYTPRNLYALQTIANKIDAEFREPALSAVFRVALAACLLPASRLNGYPGRVASLRVSGGHVRQPASRYQREVNVWRLFEAAVRDVRTAIAALGRDRRPARFAAGLEDLGGVSAANVLWIRCRPAVIGQYLPEEGVDLVLTSIAASGSVDEISFEYLATAWLIGREAAETLRLEPLFGSGPARSGAAEATALRHAIASAAGALKPDGWFVVILEGSDVDRLLSVAVAGAAGGLDLVDVIHRESRRSGEGVTLHFHKPSAEDRLRAAVQPKPLRLGAEDGRLTYPELAEAIDQASVGLLRTRGEPAGLIRMVAAVLLELQRTDLLRRVAQARPNGEAAEPSDAELEGRIERGGGLLGSLLREELERDDHPTLVRLGEGGGSMWWLRDPEIADSPLADRVEWSTFSVLSTAGRLDADGFLERIYALFPGLDSPDEELVRACLAAYGRTGDGGLLRTDDDLGRRLEEHSAVIAALVDYAHRSGLRTWVSRREQHRVVEGRTLEERLLEDERRAYLPLIIRAPAEVVGAVDAIWYVRGRLALLFEVEWTAMLGEPILRRGRQIPVGDEQARFLVFPAERTELVRLKLERSPWLRAEVERQNWHFLKWQHLHALVAGEGAGLERLEPFLGLDPLAERGGQQLTMFGE
ncbi:MAG TPA: hypothetical protein VHK28_00010 [Candidatus Limnocylindria bacterium]|nr:hypothetical protein [Candidatus Limnocylindria bacterium]